MSKKAANNKKKVVKSRSRKLLKIKWLSTKLVDDVISDEVSLFKPHLEVKYDEYLSRLWDSSPEIKDLLSKSETLEEARDMLFSFLDKEERKVFNLDNDLHILEKSIVRESIKVMRSIIGLINESRTEFSALECLWNLSKNKKEELSHKVSPGFIFEFTHLFKAITGKSNIFTENMRVKKGIPDFLKMEGREAAKVRMTLLDDLGTSLKKYFMKYPSGLEEHVADWRKENKERILNYFKSTSADWNDYKWQLRNVIKDSGPLMDLIELNYEQKEAVKKAVKNNIAFGITPYYLSLMDTRLSIGFDHAIRAQVIPPKDYVDKVVEHKTDRRCTLDFMGELDTSPIDLVTRRYPLIAIIKPFNTCPQICVYCQRNWEINDVLDTHAMAPRTKIDKALSWFDNHKSIGDVLITGGDPFTMPDSQIKYLLESLSKKKNIYRIRIGTRVPVTMPMRITEDLILLLKEMHDPPNLEIAVVTHFEHSYEITPEALNAVQMIKKTGISIYNQQVFTVENSRRFESAKLRKDLKSIGVDPYYMFNMKGKEETSSYMVPIARILQERKEEARLLPGLDRTDEPVFNIPKFGKNHLRAGQDRRIVMILPDGSRVYEFHPWEKNISPMPPYNYVDVPIFNYLEQLALRGEKVRDYRTIWYYY